MANCIIIDDEQPARELLQMHLAGLQDFLVTGTFTNALDAFHFIQKNKVDLMFLDIQMPKLSGLELIKSLKDGPRIILTTAFREYAADAFEMDVLDYLLKPITQERFMKSISKYYYYTNNAPQTAPVPDTFEQAYIFLKIGKEQVKIFLKDILYIEGLKDYIKIHAADHTYVAYDRLSYMEEKLPRNKFMRIHKSYIVAIDNISNYNNEQVTIHQKALTIGRVFKKEVIKKLIKPG
jgi:DNA-binding LytR/AlgR family response regulator